MCVYRKGNPKRGNISMIGGIISFSFIDISVPWNVNSYWVKFNNNKTNKQKAPSKKLLILLRITFIQLDKYLMGI